MLAIWRNGLPIAAGLGLCVFGVAIAQAVQTFTAHSAQLSSTKTIVIRRINVAAGDGGKGTTVVVNRSSRPAVITLSQTTPRSASTALATNLRFSVHDDTTNRCYWPRIVNGRCPTTLGAWNAASLRRVVILSRAKTTRWARLEKHKFTVVWQLPSTAPNTAQGSSSAFLLTWRAI